MSKVLRIGIQGSGSSTIADAGILAELMGQYAGIRLEAVAEDNILKRLRWLRTGKLDLFYERTHACTYLEGNQPGEVEAEMGPFQMRIVASAHSGACGFMVRADSPIKTVYDIGPNTRVAWCELISDRVYALLAWCKLNDGPVQRDPAAGRWKASIVRFDSWEANLRSIPEGRADVAVATPHNPIVKEAAAGPHRIRFLELPARQDPEGAKRFLSVFPYNPILPAPEEGVREAWGIAMPQDMACMWCLPDLDAGVTYDLTQWLHLSYALFKDKGNKLKTYTLQALRQAVDCAMAPVHEGTVRYFKEKGLWTPANEARQEYNQRLMDWYCRLWGRAVSEAGKSGVIISSSNAAWLDLWANAKKRAGIPGYRLMTDDEVRVGLRRMRG